MPKSQLERAESSSCRRAKFRAFYIENSRFRPATDSTDSARVSSTLRTLRKDGDRNARGRKGPPKPSSRKKTPQIPSQFPLVHACFQSNHAELQALIANRADVNQQVEPPLRERQPPETRASTRRTRKDAPRCTPPPIAETPNASKSSYRAVRRREAPHGGNFNFLFDFRSARQREGQSLAHAAPSSLRPRKRSRLGARAWAWSQRIFFLSSLGMRFRFAHESRRR